MSLFIQIKPDNITEEIKQNASILELNPFSHKMAFLSNEMVSRGFFSDNNLSQISAGTDQLPLLTWPFLDFFKSIDIEKNRLIELGSGNSTLWFAKNFKNVISYETNPEWYEQIVNKAPKNCLINQINEPELILCNVEYNEADWMLIDFAGRRTQFIFNMLKKNILPAIVILDNSEWYRKGASLLHSKGYIEIPFFGFKSGQMHLSCTSIFTKDVSNLKIKTNKFEIPKHCQIIKNNTWDVISD